jgi:hypothetical protein
MADIDGKLHPFFPLIHLPFTAAMVMWPPPPNLPRRRGSKGLVGGRFQNLVFPKGAAGDYTLRG